MAGDFLRRAPQLTMRQFHAFRDERPKEEKWELIDGVPMMMPPPTLMHQRIARNLETLLNTHLQGARPEWQADREVGVWLKGDEKYNPEPDVTVIETAFALEQIYVERFYFVAEILSETDRREVLEAKLAYYQQHEHNKCVLFVRQDRVGADQQDRQADGTWQARALTTPERSRFPASARSGASAISTNSRRSIHSHARDAGRYGPPRLRRNREARSWTSA
jgi:Uma2 family endonuclease